MSLQAFKRVRRALGMQVCRKPLDTFSFPGGYPIYYATSDGAALCPDCVNKEIDRVDEEQKSYAAGDRWHLQFAVLHCEANYEDTDLACDHCNEPIPAAYAD